MGVSTVLFDLGNVVCRFDAGPRLRALAAACKRSQGDVQRLVWDSGFEAECEAGRHTVEEIARHIQRSVGVRMTHAQLRSVWTLAFEPDPAVLDFVDAVRARARVGLFTNNGPLLREGLRTSYPDVMRRFDPVLFSCELGACKPDRAAYDAALRRLGEPPDRVAFLDDSPTNVEGARACGWHAILFTTVDSARMELAELFGRSES